MPAPSRLAFRLDRRQRRGQRQVAQAMRAPSHIVFSKYTICWQAWHLNSRIRRPPASPAPHR